MSSTSPIPVVLQRQALYDDVWTRPCTQIATGLGFSSSALKRICTAMDIPTPPAGHWTQIQHGKAAAKPPLPKPGAKTKLDWKVDLENSLSQKQREAVLLSRSEDGTGNCDAQDDCPRIQLASDLDNLHPLVKATRAHWKEARSRVPWDQRKDRKRFNASVAPASEERAAILPDGFARAIETLGIQFLCSLDPGTQRSDDSYHYMRQSRPCGLCWAQVGEERVSFSMRERNRRTKVEPVDGKRLWQEWKEEPSGLLEFSVESPWGFKFPTTWKDGKRQRIEEKLPEIVRTLQLVGEFKRDEEIRRRQEEEKRRIEKEYRARIAEMRERMSDQRKGEAAALDKAIQSAHDWKTASLLREYARTMEEKLNATGESVELPSPAMMYLEWLRLRADMMDPFAEAAEFHPKRLARGVPGLTQ